jgi:lysophospholipase L1-like esterase
MRMRSRAKADRLMITSVLAVTSVAAFAVPARAADATAGVWTTVWGQSQEVATSAAMNNFSCRQIVRMSTGGGSSLRVRLSNQFVGSSVTFSAVSVAQRSTDAGITAGTQRSLTFGGAASVTVAAGGDAWSDSLSYATNANQELAVSYYIAGSISQYPDHIALSSPNCTASGGGNHVADTASSSFSDHSRRLAYVTGVDTTGTPGGTIVALGDSITDGVGATSNSYNAWVDVLAGRLQDAKSTLGVVNEGISGNGMSCCSYGPTGVARFNHDVLANSNVKTVILAGGSNDISGGATAQKVIDALTQAANSAHDAGLRVVGATLIPRHGKDDALTTTGWYADASTSDARDAVRATVNNFIRTTSLYDSFVDFDAAVRDPNAPNYLAAQYNSGDWIHPSDAGHAAMAKAFNLSTLTSNSAQCTPDTTATYEIANRNSGKALNVVGSTQTDGAGIEQWTWGGWTSQKWIFKATGTAGYYYIYNLNSRKFMDISGASTADGALNTQYTWNGNNNQQWAVVDSGGYCKIRNRNSGKVLDIGAASTADGALNIQWPDNAGPQQQWTLTAL